MLETTTTTISEPQSVAVEVARYHDPTWTEGYQQTARNLTLGGLLELSYPIQVGHSITIIPELHLRGDLLSPFKATSSPLLSAGAGISAGIILFPSDSVVVPSIDLYALDDDGDRMDHAVVRNGIVGHDRHLAIAPRIVFDGGGRPSSRYAMSGGNGAFNLDSVLQLAPEAIERSLPDIIGARMREGSTRLRLVAATVPGESQDAAVARGEVVRRYLVERWGIQADRIDVAAEPGSERAVRADEVMELQTRWSAPELRLSPIRVQSVEDLPRGWVIRLLRDGRELARQSEDTAAGRLNFSLLMEELRSGVSRSPLVAELGVKDASGRTSQVRSELPFLFESDARPDTVVEYLLLAGSVDEAMLQRITAEVRRGDHVTVTGLDADGRTRADAAVWRLQRMVRPGVTVAASTAATSSASPFPGGVRVVIERRE